MQKTNAIGAAIDLVDRLAHLDSAELTDIKDKADVWYNSKKVVLFDAAGARQKVDDVPVKPKGFGQWFVWMSEFWLVRIVIGLVYSIWVNPWARKKAHAQKLEDERRQDRGMSDRRDRIRESEFDADGFDRDGFDQDGFDRDGYDEDGVHESDYEDDDYDDDDRD